jgi:type IV pilus assembly protein PilX
MALITSLLLLLVVTIIAISMFRSFGTQEKIAGNTREKQRALNAAVSAQQYAEWFLVSGNAPGTTSCTAPVSASPGQVCNAWINAQNDYTILPWNIYVTYSQFTTNEGNGVVNYVGAIPTVTGTGTNTVMSYYQSPAFYITDLGKQSGGAGEVYQVDAVGYGGTANSVAVVESTYLVTTNTAGNPNQ